MLMLVGKVLMALAILARLYWRPLRSREMIYHWAADHHYTVLAIHSCKFFRGPCVSTKEQAVFRVVLRVKGNKERVAWIQCGGRLCGVASHTMLVQWDD